MKSDNKIYYSELFKMADYAVMYWQMGFSIFPVWQGTKDKPVVSWKKYMTERATLDEVKDWWTKYPNANIAIVTGSISGIFVLDTEKDFDLNNIDVKDEYATAITGSGGRHFYFWLPKDKQIKTHIEIWGKDPSNKADIKSEGGYVIAPPSFNEQRQSYYSWTKEQNVLTEAPEWLLTYVETLSSSNDSHVFNQIANGVSEGSRNSSASSFIGHVVLKTEPDMWEIVAWPAVKSWNEKNTPPLDDDELRRTFESICNREFDRRKGVINFDDLANYSGEDRVISSHELKSILDVNSLHEIKYLSEDLSPLDRLCDGFVPGELYIVSGPEKSGKTSLLQFLTTSFSRQNYPVLWFTYEMTSRELLKKFKELPVFYLPAMNKSYDLKWLEARILEAKKKFDIKFVMIDHLEFVLDAAQQNNLAVQLGTVVRYLKNIAREQDLVLFVIHHVKRLEEGMQPTVRDLRDSALIAAEADSTIMIWRLPKGKVNKKKYLDTYIEYGNESMIKVCNNRRTGIVEKSFRVKYDFETNSYMEIEGDEPKKTEYTKEDIDNILSS